MNKAAARKLTKQINSTTDELWMLVQRAHDEGAWSALGKTWKEYVETELTIGKRHANRLLNLAEVITAVENATGGTRVSHLTGRAADDIKPHLSVVTDAVADAVKGVPDIEREEVTRRVVERERARIKAEKNRKVATAKEALAKPPPVATAKDIERAFEAATAFAMAVDSYPPAEVVAAAMTGLPADEYRRALNWLSKFHTRWNNAAYGDGHRVG